MASANILITGCSSGIGLATVKLFVAKGYRVLATARREQDLLMLEALGAEPISLDLNDSASVTQCLQLVQEKTQGSIGFLVNNAAYAQPGCVEDVPVLAMRQQFETNVFATLELTQQILVMMRKHGAGRIIFISSMLGFMTMPARSIYCASKYALESLISGLRMELKGSGIDIISIRPGPIQSQFRQRAKHEFNQYVEVSTSHSKACYDAFEKQQAMKKIPFSKSAEAVAKKIYKVVTAEKPKAHYQITLPAHLFLFLSRMLPTRALDWLVSRM